jgi:hypothetical protein
LTRERIRQIEAKAIGLVRSHLKASKGRDKLAPDDSELPEFELNKLAASTSKAGSTDATDVPAHSTSGSPSPTIRFADNVDRSDEIGRGGSRSPNAFTERQLELLYVAKANGIRIMSYLVSGRYETLVMLIRKNSQQEMELAAELLAAGFRFKPGHGYHV